MSRSTPEARTKTEKRWLKVLSTLNEFQARLFVADKALDLGRGGISWLSQLTGMSRTTITKAVQELHRGKELRVPFGGRCATAGRRTQETGANRPAAQGYGQDTVKIRTLRNKVRYLSILRAARTRIANNIFATLV
jgi:hypothetical protein